MGRATYEPIHIPDHIWRRQQTTAALRARDIGALFRIAKNWDGASQNRIAAMTGVPQPRVNALINNKGGPIEKFTVFENIAAGLNMPDHARVVFGLAPRSFIAPGQQKEIAKELGLRFPDSINAGINASDDLWSADLAAGDLTERWNVAPNAWNETSLRWLVSSAPEPLENPQGGTRIGAADVDRFNETIESFAQLDNRFGGGHARRAFIQYLANDATRMLHGAFTEETGRNLYSAIAEATLLAAWMSYDSAPSSGLAQRYFVQALGFANAAGNRLLGASILDAMSHQATYVGRYRDAANLAAAARTGTQGVATPTLKAHFLAMEARALARLGEAKACDRTLAEAVTAFEKRTPDDDPPWISYFDEAELAAEMGHCFRDLGRHVDATQYANQCLGAIDDAVFLRSDFFATMVLADAYLDSGEPGQACTVALRALKIGEQLRSARSVGYLREFRERLARVGTFTGSSDFITQARDFRLWRIASAQN